MSARIKDGLSKFHAEREFLSTGSVGASSDNPWLVGSENQLRVVVENVGGGNSLTCYGRIKNQQSYVSIATILGSTLGTTIDISLIDEIYFDCTSYAASGGTPKLVASGFFKKLTSGSSDTASNLGGGEGVFASKVGNDFQFKSLVEGDGITLTPSPTEIEISSTATRSPKTIITFDSDAFTDPGDFVKVNGANSVTAIADNSVTEMPNGIFGVCFSKPTSVLAEVIFVGVMDGYSGLTIGQPVFVDTSGLPTQTPPITGMSQQIGFAVSSTEIFLYLGQAMRRS